MIQATSPAFCFLQATQRVCKAFQITDYTEHRKESKLTIKGSFQYQKAFGPKSPTEEMDLESTFIMASCTKIMTTISVLQCVERGQIDLDDDVSDILTELKDIQILTGFKEDTEKGIYKKAENKITLR